MMNFTLIAVSLTALSCISCSSNDTTGGNSGIIAPGNDPNFTIVANSDAGLTNFNRKVVVFGIDIYAVAGVEDTKLLHAANIMAQYLDNNEDGIVDDQAVINQMVANKAYLVMWVNESDLSSFPPGRIGQDLGNAETNPNYVSSGLTGRFDAALEEVLHIINNAGHSRAYPNAFGQNQGSQLANAMDIARGGQFFSIPSSYPSSAWYTYSDSTCDYATCQTIEYMYWALTSILGAQATNARLNEIGHEWKLNTKDKVQQTDTAIYNLLTDSQYKMPTVLPDGTYMR